jgi:hypothetical protein
LTYESPPSKDKAYGQTTKKADQCLKVIDPPSFIEFSDDSPAVVRDAGWTIIA